MTSPSSESKAAGSPGAPEKGGQEKSPYRSTLNLPKTAFAMKANLVQNEPASMKRWDAMRLYEKVEEVRAKSPRFVFHDGPPYANGSIHLGHLLNKVLKDLVVRTSLMADHSCPYIPGWDCHGLPIEHKVMTELMEAGKLEKLKGLPTEQRQMAVRRECRKYAEKYVKLQAGQMQRLLTLADYEHPYLTMSPEYEGATLEVLADLMEQGLVYRALKPVHWSIANETALAEAELEYYDREDTSVYVDFEAEDGGAVYDAFGLPEEDLNAEDAGSTEEEDAAGEDGVVVPEPGIPEGRPDTRPTFMIWTTTPWTLPANLAIAVNPEITYALVFVDGNVTVMAQDAVERVTKAAKAEDVKVLATAKGSQLVGLWYRHPFVDRAELLEHFEEAAEAEKGAHPEAVYSIVAADYVTLEDGTGLVHTAPGHGAEDFATGRRVGLPVYCPVLGDGRYDQTVPEFVRGLSIWKANDLVVQNLRESGHLYYDHKFVHSYPHDWRGKTPVIFRCTEQWFIGVDLKTKRQGKSLREMAMAAVSEEGVDEAAVPPGRGKEEGRTGETPVSPRAGWRPAPQEEKPAANEGTAAAQDVRFIPEWGRNRMRGMLESRPDWCISRQRSWGLPIPAFFAQDGRVLMTPASVRAVARLVREKGSDVWFTASADDLLAYYQPGRDPHLPQAFVEQPSLLNSVRKGQDILDVWFESGSSWNAVIRERFGDKDFPTDLYLEGSDQHRGWFQSSLTTSLGATGLPPYRSLLTHGFMVDKDGRKMSKSLGNTLEVEDLLKDYGADVCRWWVASLSYENDIKVDKSFFDVAGESYRKVRNTLRFMLSNLDDYKHDGGLEARPPEYKSTTEVPAPASLEAWVLSEYERMAKAVTEAYARYEFQTAHKLLYDFCNDTLSATYLAAIKDRMYCDRVDSGRRRRAQGALWRMTYGLCTLLAPVLPHTADEAFRSLWKAGPDDQARCVHLETFVTEFGVSPDTGWAKAMEALAAARVALERAKAEGIENPLDAGVVLPDPDWALSRFEAVDLADLLGVSRVKVDATASAARVMDLRGEARCERSWKRDGTVRKRSDGGMLSDRDAGALGVE